MKLSPHRLRGFAVALPAVLASAIAAACSNDSKQPASEGVRPKVAGSAAQFANCREWNAATVKQRKVTVRDLRGQLTAQSDPDARSVLSDARAYELFQRSCKESYASELRLYKLYVRAQAFEPLRTD